MLMTFALCTNVVAPKRDIAQLEQKSWADQMEEASQRSDSERMSESGEANMFYCSHKQEEQHGVVEALCTNDEPSIDLMKESVEILLQARQFHNSHRVVFVYSSTDPTGDNNGKQEKLKEIINAFKSDNGSMFDVLWSFVINYRIDGKFYKIVKEYSKNGSDIFIIECGLGIEHLVDIEPLSITAAFAADLKAKLEKRTREDVEARQQKFNQSRFCILSVDGEDKFALIKGLLNKNLVPSLLSNSNDIGRITNGVNEVCFSYFSQQGEMNDRQRMHLEIIVKEMTDQESEIFKLLRLGISFTTKITVEGWVYRIRLTIYKKNGVKKERIEIVIKDKC